MAQSGHHVSVADRDKQPIAPAHHKGTAGPPPQYAESKALYKQRKQTVEPVFGIIKEVLGFRRFSMRGKEKAEKNGASSTSATL